MLHHTHFDTKGGTLGEILFALVTFLIAPVESPFAALQKNVNEGSLPTFAALSTEVCCADF